VIPADDETVLAFEKIRSLIENYQVVRIALEPLLVRLLFATGYINLPLA
jgi:hypothetical protein